jgi:hypothetical protein
VEKPDFGRPRWQFEDKNYTISAGVRKGSGRRREGTDFGREWPVSKRVNSSRASDDDATLIEREG